MYEKQSLKHASLCRERQLSKSKKVLIAVTHLQVWKIRDSLRRETEYIHEKVFSINYPHIGNSLHQPWRRHLKLRSFREELLLQEKGEQRRNGTLFEDTVVKGKERIRRWEVTVLWKQKGAKTKHRVILQHYQMKKNIH